MLRLQPGEFLADAVAALAPDVVLVDMARPDRDALDGIRRVTGHNPRPIVLFVDQDDPAFMEEAISAGVSSYNVPGLPPPGVKPILRAAASLFRVTTPLGKASARRSPNRRSALRSTAPRRS
jgi:response regulator NasT